jgi:hypothetical protein
MRGDVTPPPLRTSTAEVIPRSAQGRGWQVLFNSRPRYILSGAIVDAPRSAPDSDLAGAGRGMGAIRVIMPQPHSRPSTKRKRSASHGGDFARKWRAMALMSMVRTNVIKAGSVICIRVPREKLRPSRKPAPLHTVYEGFITSAGAIQRRGETHVSLSDFAFAAHAHGGAHGPNPYEDGWVVTYVKRKSCTLVDVFDASGTLITDPGAFVSVADVDRARGALAQNLASPDASARARSNSRSGLRAPNSAKAPRSREGSAEARYVRAARDAERRQAAIRRRAAKRRSPPLQPTRPTKYQQSMPTSVPVMPTYASRVRTGWARGGGHRGSSPAHLADAMMLQRAMGAQAALPPPSAAAVRAGAPIGLAAIVAPAATISPPPPPPHALRRAAWEPAASTTNSCSTQSLHSVLTVMLEAFYRRVNVGKVKEAATIAKYYASDLAALNAQLMQRYGHDLQSVTPEDAAEVAVEGGTAPLPH